MATSVKQAAKPVQQAKAQVPAVQKSADIVVQDKAPDYIQTGTNRGAENMDIADIAIPRLEIVQGLSPALKPNDAGYIEGAKLGDLDNSVTRQLYGREVMIIPVFYTKQWLVWKDQKKGGGFAGAYDDIQAAEAAMDSRGLKEEDGWAVIDTPQYLCLLLGDKVQEVMVSMPRTKAKVARQWNAMMRLAEGDMFSRVYQIGTVEEKKDNNTFYNFTVKMLGFPSKALYESASALYGRIMAGKKQVVMDISHLNAGTDTEM